MSYRGEDRVAAGYTGRRNDRALERPPWSPAQLVAIALGVAFLVVGGVALARTGIDFGDLHSKKVDVAGLGHTQLLGWIELAVGLLLMAAGAVPGAGRGLMSLLGILLIAGGLIVAIQPSSFTDWLGVDRSSGVVYVVAGAVLLLAAITAPVIFGRASRGSARTVRNY